jgi:hypothetical protein
MTCQLYLPPYRAYYDQRREDMAKAFGLDERLPWIFFPENFAAAFLTPQQIRGRIRRGFAPDHLALYVDLAKTTFKEVMTWCSQADAKGSFELIIRPRPGILREAFKRAFVDAVGSDVHRHVHFIKDLSVRQWILASDAVISSYSSSLVESAVAGTPAYLVGSRPIPTPLASEWIHIPEQISSFEQFLVRMRGVSEARPPDYLSDWAVNNLLAWGDPIVNVAGVLADAAMGRLRVKRATRNSLRHMARDCAARLKSQALRYGGAQRSNTATSFGHENDHITVSAIEESTNRWRQVLAGQRGIPAPILLVSQ